MKKLMTFILVLLLVNFVTALELSDIDFNHDYKIDLQDLFNILPDFTKTSEFNQEHDVNADGRVGIYDIVLIAKNLGKDIPLERDFYFDSRLGVAHVAGTYPDRHNEEDFLIYGARKVYELGFQSIEVFMDPRICWRAQLDKRPHGLYQTRKYCQPDSDVSKYNSLAELAQDSDYEYLFNMPFLRYIITTDSLNPRAANQWKIGRDDRSFSQDELDIMYEEFFDFTNHILTTYSNTGKTFIILTPSEIDWHMVAPLNCKPHCNDVEPEQVNIDNAIVYLNTISQAINDARIDNPPQGMKLYHACEVMFLVRKAEGLKTAVTDVIPHTTCDLVAYSAHEAFRDTTEEDQNLIVRALDKIAENAPDHQDFGGKNVMISEVGYKEIEYVDIDPQLFGTFIKKALGWGVPYLQLWQVYDNECEQFNPSNEQCKGYWMIKPDGTFGKIYADVMPGFESEYTVSLGGKFGDAVITGVVDDSALEIKTTARLAGAIDSLTWKGKEFVDSYDHGRQIQTALFVNDFGQCYNPTEAGSAADGTGETSTSKLLEISAVGNTLYTKTQMAFWQTPGSYYEGCYFDLNAPNPPWRGGYAVNEKALSEFILEKTVTIGYANMQNVIEYVSTITIPDNLGLTIEYFILSNPAIYLPTEFSSFYRYDPSTNTLTNMPTPAYGYSTIPAIATTPNGDYAIGLYTAEIPSNGFLDNEQFLYTGYEVIDWSDFGNVMLLNARMPKTNHGLPFTSGKYTYRSFLIVGRIEDVKSSMTQIYNMHPPIE